MQAAPVPSKGNSVQSGQDGRSNRDSGFGAVGLNLLAALADDDDEDDDDEDGPDEPVANKHAALLAAATGPPGLPGYSAQNANATQQPSPMHSTHPAMPEPKHAQGEQTKMPSPDTRTQPTIISSHGPRKDMQIVIPQTAQPIPRMPQPAFMASPSPTRTLTPLPLQAPKTPILPVFARPSDKEVKFLDAKPILRGNSEETLLPRNTAKGDEFWRRFSMVAKDDHVKRNKRSTWLVTHEARSSRMSLMVWLMGIFLLICIGGAVVLIWFLTRNTAPELPKALGGNASEGVINATSTTASTIKPSGLTSSPLHTVTGDLPPSTTPPIPFTTQAVVTTAVN
ncbi:hypothetical protein SISSUDRAFT_1056771 [Sistotremastrum suecicum HHB10207 ss-3]|uniref:Uncharacterized protein n=1 Tax=Sistotremastrum suecicum HHB10207 ss-3 TaxID=1314776 RepID=A0A166J6F1_9AGAM|nr:hypothetical protein SISSUDRAFT_1056771 [Sistotremastrum suecicum HHB10207 ss-3]